MLTMIKPTTQPCFWCGRTDDTVECQLEGKAIVLCWRDAKQVFKTRSNGKKDGDVAKKRLRRKKRREPQMNDWPDEIVQLTARGALVFDIAQNISEQTGTNHTDILDIIIRSLDEEGKSRAHGEGRR